MNMKTLCNIEISGGQGEGSSEQGRDFKLSFEPRLTA